MASPPLFLGNQDLQLCVGLYHRRWWLVFLIKTMNYRWILRILKVSRIPDFETWFSIQDLGSQSNPHASLRHDHKRHVAWSNTRAFSGLNPTPSTARVSWVFSTWALVGLRSSGLHRIAPFGLADCSCCHGPYPTNQLAFLLDPAHVPLAQNRFLVPPVYMSHQIKACLKPLLWAWGCSPIICDAGPACMLGPSTFQPILGPGPRCSNLLSSPVGFSPSFWAPRLIVYLFLENLGLYFFTHTLNLGRSPNN